MVGDRFMHVQPREPAEGGGQIDARLLQGIRVDQRAHVLRLNGHDFTPLPQRLCAASFSVDAIFQ